MSSVYQLSGQWIVGSAPGVLASHALLEIFPSGSPALQLDDGIGDSPVLDAHGIGCVPFFGDVSNPYLGIGRYLRPIDPLSCFWSHERAADGSRCERCDRGTSPPAETVSRLES